MAVPKDSHLQAQDIHTGKGKGLMQFGKFYFIKQHPEDGSHYIDSCVPDEIHKVIDAMEDTPTEFGLPAAQTV